MLYRCAFVIIFITMFGLATLTAFAKEKSQSDKVFEQRTGRDSQGYRSNSATQREFAMRAYSKRSGGAAVAVNSNDKKTVDDSSSNDKGDWDKIAKAKAEIDQKIKAEQRKNSSGADGIIPSNKSVEKYDDAAPNNSNPNHETDEVKVRDEKSFDR